MVYGTYNYSIRGVYKQSNITGAPHCKIEDIAYIISD